MVPELRPVVAESVAFFGKGSAEADYQWLRGEGNLPAGMARICERLVASASQAETLISLVAVVGKETFLARIFRGYVDSAGRPAYCLDVAVLQVAEAIRPADWPLIAHLGLKSRLIQNLGVHLSRQELLVPEAPEQQVVISPEIYQSICLGLPLSIGDSQVLTILRRFGWRFGGVVLSSGGGRPHWFRELSPYLAIEFAEVSLSPEEEVVIEAVRRRPPGEAEWKLLEAFPSRELVQNVVVWASWAAERDEVEAPTWKTSSDIREEVVQRWLATFYSEGWPKESRFTRFSQAISPVSPTVGHLGILYPDLSLPARMVFLGNEKPNSGTLEELALSGLLGGDSLPLKVWISWIGESEILRQAALDLLVSKGYSLSASVFALGKTARVPLSTELEEAARLLAVEELPLPVSELLRLMGLGAEGFRAVEEMSKLISGKAAELVELVKFGRIPPPGVLNAPDLARGLELAQRGAPSDDLDEVLLDLIFHKRNEDVEAVVSRLGSYCSRTTLRLIEGKRDGSPVVVEDLKIVERWVAKRLITPGQVVPDSNLAEIAGLWPETKTLSAFLSGEQIIPTGYPESWLQAIRSSVDFLRVSKLVKGITGEDKFRAIAWWASTWGLASWLVDLATDGEIPRAPPRVARGALIFAIGHDGSAGKALARLARLGKAEYFMENQAPDSDLEVEIVIEQTLPKGMRSRLEPLLVHLLTRKGPFPSLGEIAPAAVASLISLGDPVKWVNALFLCQQVWDSEEVVAVLSRRIEEEGIVYPPDGYTSKQLAAQPFLAGRLGALPGWEALDRNRRARERLLVDLVFRNGFTIEEAVECLTGLLGKFQESKN